MEKLQRERMLTQIEHHRIAIAALARYCGVENPDGKRISDSLRKIEARAHKAAEDLCNIPDQDENWENTKELTEFGVASIFNHKLSGFFVNGDPRGYALKIDTEENNKLRELGIKLQTDWGGYGLLAPTFDGN